MKDPIVLCSGCSVPSIHIRGLSGLRCSNDKCIHKGMLIAMEGEVQHLKRHLKGAARQSNWAGIKDWIHAVQDGRSWKCLCGVTYALTVDKCYICTRTQEAVEKERKFQQALLENGIPLKVDVKEGWTCKCGVVNRSSVCFNCKRFWEEQEPIIL